MQTLEHPLSDRFLSICPAPLKPIAVVACLLLALAPGCAEPPAITKRTVRKPPKPPRERILAAVVPIGRNGWFFKISGHSQAVAAQESSFQNLLNSLEIDGGKPAWKTPDGWVEEPGSGMRKATFKIQGDDRTLECSVIQLPDPNGNPASPDYVLANVNRWRGQLGREPLSAADLQRELEEDQEIHTLNIAGDQVRVTWVNIEGHKGSGQQTPMSGAPFAGGAGASSGSPPFAGGGGMKSRKGGRMLAAIVPVGKMGWFFKIEGADAAVTAQEKNFVSLLTSLRIEEDRPQWQIPASWQELAGTGMRAATFQIGQGPEKLECSVIPLPATDPGASDYLLANINRWRGQVGLPSISESQLASDLKEADSGEVRVLTSGGNIRIPWVNLGGGTGDSDSTSGQPPVRSPGPARVPGAARPQTGQGGAADRTGPGLTYRVPDEWAPAAPRTMVLVGWDVKQDSRSLQIYISRLGAAGSRLVDNVNRWRGQVGLKPLPADQVQSSVDTVTVGGSDGHIVEIRGADRTIIGAIIVRGDTGWFFKLQGDPLLATQEKKRFETWLKSVQFDSPDPEKNTSAAATDE